MPYRLAPRAEIDLDDLYLHGVEAFGERAAERYLSSLLDTFELIARFPEIGMMLRKGYRRFVHRPHIILYLPLGDTVQIERVVHGHSNWREHLG